MIISSVFGGQSPHKIATAIDSTNTVYERSLVYSTGDGIKAIGTASGASDTTNERIPFGIVMGLNDDPLTFDTTLKRNYMAGVLTQAAQTARSFKYRNLGGKYPAGDPLPYAQVDLITPTTVLEAPLYNATYGVAPTVLTVTTGSSDGLGFTSNATEFTPIADLATTYCRSGANKGIYRISDDTSTTVATNDVAFPYDIAVGDTFVRVPLRPNGVCRCQFDTNGIFINTAATLSTDYYSIIVLALDLSVAGKEKVHFCFTADHFTTTT